MLLAMEAQANPSSVHRAGRNARRIVDAARDTIGGLIGSRSDDIIFTSGGTEANALAIRGALAKIDSPLFIYSDLEHPAVRDIALSGRYDVHRIMVTADGQIDLTDLEVVLAASDGLTPFLAIMLANNETGVVQPVSAAAAMVREHGGFVHCDAVQAVGKIPVSVGMLGVDYLAMSSHKCGGPQGVGALWIRAGAPLLPQQIGGGQERSIRSGTENLTGIAGFAAALSASDIREEARVVSCIRNEFELKLIGEGLEVFGAESDRLPGTSCIALEGFRGETQVMAMDLAGFAVSSGSACSSGKVRTSSVLTAMGASDALASSALRVSFGWASTHRDADMLADAWLKAAKRAVPAAFTEFA